MNAIVRTNLVLILLLIFAGVAAAGPTTRAVLQPANDRKPAPNFVLKDSSGHTAKIVDYRGKVVLLDFWATWCAGCKAEIDYFSGLEKKYGSKGLRVVGISIDEGGWKVLKPFLADTKVSYRILLSDDTTAQNYGIKALPDTFLIDRKGRIAAAYTAGLVDQDDVDTNIKAILEGR
jgi:peroxiredoxin